MKTRIDLMALGVLLRESFSKGVAPPSQALLDAVASLRKSPGSFEQYVVKEIPHLLRYARSLAKKPELADDLVQETVYKALKHADKFEAGTNLSAWLATILRNSYISQLRRTRAFEPEEAMGELPTPPHQEAQVELSDVQAALAELLEEQREALLLVSLEGFSYEEVAKITGVKVGTVKSRVHRARLTLLRALERSL